MWILLTVLGVLAVLVFGAIVAAGVMTFRRVQEKKAASTAALAQFEKSANEERSKMADLIENGEVAGGDAAIGRVKEQLDKSAGHMSPGEAEATRAMSAYLGKLQAQVREYEGATAKLSEAEILTFRLRDKAALEGNRQIVRDFLASNARLTDMFSRNEELIRAEMESAKVPAKAREAALAGVSHSQKPLRPLQLKIRACDKTLGEAALTILDQLDREWGKWQLDEAAGGLRFNDDATLAAHNALIEKVQTASAEQAEAQKELATRLRAAGRP